MFSFHLCYLVSPLVWNCIVSNHRCQYPVTLCGSDAAQNPRAFHVSFASQQSVEKGFYSLSLTLHRKNYFPLPIYIYSTKFCLLPRRCTVLNLLLSPCLFSPFI